MEDWRDERLAAILVDYSCEVKPGDRVALYGSPEAEPLMRSLYRRVLRAGGHPYPFMGYEVYLSYGGFDDIFFREASDHQLQHVYRTEEMVRAQFEAMVVINSKRNTRSLSGVDPERQRLRNAAYRDVMKAYRERSARGELKWVVTMYPTRAHAQDAELSQQEFADFLYGACYADRENGVEMWQRIEREQAALVDHLAGKREIEVKGANVDLRLSIHGRRFLNSAGHKNMPDGEIYTSPVEDSVEGWVRFTYPAVRYGVPVEGIELHFEQGEVVRATAEKNEAFLQRMLETDAGARYIGEFAIGTNEQIERFTSNLLFDEKIGGTFHLAVGSGFPEAGSRNESAIHWDMISDLSQDGEVWVDGELFYQQGRFLVNRR